MATKVMLPSFSGVPQRRIRDVFDHQNMGGGLGGYQYV